MGEDTWAHDIFYMLVILFVGLVDWALRNWMALTLIGLLYFIVYVVWKGRKTL